MNINIIRPLQLGVVAAWLLAIAIPGFCADPKPAFPPSALVHAQDSTFGYYPYGFRGRNPAGDIIFGVETSRYGMVVNASRARIDRIGSMNSVSANDAVARDKEVLLDLPPTSLEFSLQIGDEKYIADEAAPKSDAVVLQRMGRYLQHFEIRDVVFHKTDGTRLEGVTAKLEFYCWVDRFSATLSVTSDRALENVIARATLILPAEYKDAQAAEAHGIGAVNPLITAQDLKFTSPSTFDWESHAVSLDGGKSVSISAVIVPASESLAASNYERQQIQEPLPPGSITAEGIAPYIGPLAVTDDPVKGWTEIRLGENPDIWTTERVKVRIKNPSDFPRTVRLNIAKEGGSFGITGMSPILRDTEGHPLGLPVQISKNWHCRPGWFSGLTMLELEPHVELEFEFTLAYADWGGVPPVSHAQLGLDGYGGNQQWDQLALGSFGESICYDPDVNLTRSMVDDLRPLMVWGMGEKEKIKWSWTHNVGGADFLVLFTGDKNKPAKQYLTSQKTLYASYGPVISDVTYAGEALDGAIKSRIRTQTWRTDDYVRALYTIRYDVRRETNDIQRLAFFQLAADRYNENLFEKITRGDLSGEKETWIPEKGDEQYSRRGIPLEGELPWFALYEGSKPPNIKAEDKGAWANRGLIVRSWKAKLGGVDCPTPTYSVYGTGQGASASTLVEISPPQNLARLAPGDFVETEIEMLILPQFAADYYGPNKSLIHALEAHPNDWHLVHREVEGSNLSVTSEQGSVESTFPIRIKTENGRLARFTVTGGIGYTPLTIIGASSPGPFDLVIKRAGGEERIDQSKLGNDWWQTDDNPTGKKWDLTFTLPLDVLRGVEKDLTLEWRLRE